MFTPLVIYCEAGTYARALDTSVGMARLNLYVMSLVHLWL